MGICFQLSLSLLSRLTSSEVGLAVNTQTMAKLLFPSAQAEEPPHLHPAWLTCLGVSCGTGRSFDTESR